MGRETFCLSIQSNGGHRYRERCILNSQTTPTVAITTTLKTSIEQTCSYVNYHLNTGIDRIYLFFDDPEDTSVELLSDNPRITIFRCSIHYWESETKEILPDLDRSILINRQRINANYTLNICRKDCIDWLIHIDSDELIYPDVFRLKKYLNRTKFKIIRFTILEAVSEKMTYENAFAEIQFFKKPTITKVPAFFRYPVNSLKFLIAKYLSTGEAFQINKRFFRSHTKSKVCISTELDILDMKIHSPATRKRYYTHRSISLFLLHFDSCGYEYWKNRWKFKLGGGEIPASRKGDPIRGKMINLFDGEQKDESLMKAYKSLHTFNIPDFRLFRFFGLIKKIDYLDRHLFLPR